MNKQSEQIVRSLRACSEPHCAKCAYWGDGNCKGHLCKDAADLIDELTAAELDSPMVRKVKINTHGNPLPERHGEWVDLLTAEETTVPLFMYKEIDLGVSMELPEGYYAEIVPRSSTCKKYGIILANSFGVIDHAYCGDNDRWCFPAVAITQTVTIPKGTRIAQFRIVPQNEPFEFEQVESLGNADRGGLGSTGD